jgi:hypothetical protein
VVNVVTAELKYCRENIERFFKWKMNEVLQFYDYEIGCEDVANDYARDNPQTVGYLIFKSNYRGKRFFWVENQTAEELEGMDCYLRVMERRHLRAKSIIHSRLFKTKKS